MVTRIALVDDQPIIISALRTVFESVSDFNIVASGTSLRDAIDIAKQHRPDILIIDPTMQGDPFAAIAAMVAEHSRTKIVAFSPALGADYAVRALQAGASGYVLKKSSAEELLEAVRAVCLGETYIARSFTSEVIGALRNQASRKKAAEVARLSWREEQIVRLLLRGGSNKEIAAKLSISDKTVKHYMSAVMQKLQVRNRTEAVIAAQKLSPFYRAVCADTTGDAGMAKPGTSSETA